MKSILFILGVLFFYNISVYSQEKAFSIQLNTGYTYMLGKKLSNSSENFGLASFNSGQIPIGIEVRYKFINHILWNPRYKERMQKWSNYFTDRLYFNFGYTTFLGIPYVNIKQGTNFKDIYRYNLNSHTLRIGMMYDFTNDFERLLQCNFKRVHTYVGLDFVLFLQKVNNQYSATLQNESLNHGIIKSNLFANFGIMPKVEVEYYLPAKAFAKDRFSQWWFNHSFYLNAAVQYTMIVSSQIKNFPLPEQYQQNILNHSLNFNIGIGFRF